MCIHIYIYIHICIAPPSPGDLLLEIDILSAVLLLFYIMFTIFSVLNAGVSVRDRIRDCQGLSAPKDEPRRV